jgi:hypothetical protein
VSSPREFSFEGWLVWLTPEQGGRVSGPPESRDTWPHYAANAFVPPDGVEATASFVLKDFESGAWKSRAKGCWLVPDDPDQPWVEPGTVIVVTEGPKPVAYFTVDTADA